MKKLLFLSFLTILFFSSCASTHENEGNNTKAISEEISKRENLEKELDKIAQRTYYFLDIIISNYELAEDFESAVEVLKNFKKDFPNLFPSYEEYKIRDFEQKLKLKNEKAERLKLPAEKRITKRYDEISGITWYEDPDQPRVSNRVYLYIGKKGNEKWLRFVIEYSASKWLFINKYTFKIDDEIETITPDFNEIKRDVLFAEHIYETLDCNAKRSIYRIASKIANSKRTLLRYHGEQHISDRELTKEEIQSLKTILEAYEKL